MSAPRRFDLICLGRAAVDFYGEQIGGRLEDMTSFAKYLGGCAANIAVGASRLGLRVAMLTRVGDEHMGRFVRETLAAEGVDVSHVATDPARLTGLVVLGIRDEATFPLIFYRENCADMAIGEADVDPGFIASAAALLVTGTHFSTRGVDAASRAAIAAARQAGTRVVLDIDYRPVLWGLTGHGLGEERFVASDRVTAHLQSILPLCDLIVGTEEEIHIAGGSTDTLAAVARIRDVTPATIVVKRGAQGCVVVEGPAPTSLEQALVVPGFPTEVFNVLGAGDGFMAGLLSGVLRGRAFAESARTANACGALVVSRHGCAPAMPSAVELEDFLTRADGITKLHEDARTAHLHRATTTRCAAPEIFALAFDHRRQFAEMAAIAGADIARVQRFKRIVADALLALPPEQSGAIVDTEYGLDALRRLTGTGRWLARPLEQPGSRPVALALPRAAVIELRSWPAEHVAKILVSYDADDPPDLRAAQHAVLAEVQAACHATARRWLLEVIPERWEGRPGRVAQAVDALYRAGLAPDWWKLPPMADPWAWAAAGTVLRRHDPLCRGIVILGLDRPDEELDAAFAAAAREPSVVGFAVGRSVFRETAEAFLSGAVDEDAAARAIIARHRRILALWDARRNRSVDEEDRKSRGAASGSPMRRSATSSPL